MVNSLSTSKICFFSGVPIDDAATLHRSGLVAKKLAEKGYKVLFTSVSANFNKKETRKASGLEVLFCGQAHYRAQKPFSTRQRLGVGEALVENLKTCLRFAKILREEKPNKVLVVTAMPVSLMVGLVAKILGFKTLIDVEDLVTGQMEASGYPKFLVGLYGYIEKIWVRIFDKVAVCSHYLAERYPGAVILPNMVEVEWWRKQKNRKTSLPAGKAEEQRNIVFVGQIGPYHGQEEVLQALTPILKNHQNLTLTFVGGGERLDKLKVKSEKLKLTTQVILTGQVSQDRVRQILGASDIGLLPLWDIPVHRARHPLKLLEYLAAGLVVVTNNVGEAAKVIKDGGNGILCPAGDIRCLAQEVEMIIENPSLAGKISEKARVSARQFSSEKILPKWIKALEL